MWAKVGAVVGLSFMALRAHAQTGPWFGGIYGEGYTSNAQDEPVEFESRMFSAPMFPALCDELPAKPARLEFYAEEIRLHVGERLSLSTVVLRARDRTGALVPKVPFVADVYYELSAFERDYTSLDGPWLVGAEPGRGRAVFYALCADAERGPVQLEIPIVIVP